MDSTSYYISQLIFRNKVLELNGNAFEDFFSKIMRLHEEGFTQIKPQGNIGDRKNDGLIKVKGHYFQVYSPEKPKESDSKGAKKALQDFKGLYKYWNDICKIKKFSFVFNDKYKGVYPEIQAIILDLGKKYSEIEFEIFDMYNLESIFLGLSENDIQSIIGFIPKAENINLSIDALTKVIEGLSNRNCNIYSDKLIVPNFDEKILFNGLSDKIKSLLIKAGFDNGLLEDFFHKNSNKTIRNFLKDILRGYYEDGIKKGYSKDKLYYYIYNQIIQGLDVNKSIHDSILILMSYYFESCDIFKEPN